MATYIRNPLQSHYSAGCAFADAYARRLAQVCSFPVKTVNWGFWDLGAGVPEKLARLAEVGIAAIEPEQAMSALDTLLGGPVHQLGFMQTSRPVPSNSPIATGMTSGCLSGWPGVGGVRCASFSVYRREPAS